MVKLLGDDSWGNAYVEVELPNDAHEIRDTAWAAFGSRVVAVVPTAEQFNQFNGVNYAGALYLNLDAERDYCN